MTGLHQADGAEAARIQVRREAAQDRVGVLIRLINEGGEIAASVEHGLVCLCEQSDRGEVAIPDIISHRQALATGPNKLDGNNLTLAFKKAGEKKVVDSFVERV